MTLPKTSLWPGLWVLLLAAGWLSPNHYPPWTSFHLDAWIAVVTLAGCAGLAFLPPQRSPVSGMVVMATCLLLVPGLQYVAGIVHSGGNVWISSAYLLGFLLALLAGGRWEVFKPGQLLDCLFAAIAIAAVLSVGLQLHQWLGLERLELLTMGNGVGRPFANFGQPNQLGTFLLWALLALLWGYVRRQIGAPVAMFAALFLLFGVALTVSRTAWVGLSLLLAAIWIWRGHWPSPRLPLAATVLGVFFVLYASTMRWMTEVVLGSVLADHGDTARLTSESRPTIWAMFLDAIGHRPWLGYGWNQTALAQSEVSLDHSRFHVFFSSAHNLFLDLVIWCGIPLGLAIAGWLCWWAWTRLRRVANAENAVVLLFLLVVANHAMLELPLQHAYLLLPVGLVIGALDVRLGLRPLALVGRSTLLVLWLAAAGLLGLIIRDYSRIEPAYETLRYEWANIKTQPAQPPDVWVLTQWRDFVQLVRFEPRAGMSEKELQWMREVVPMYPSSGFFMKLARSLAMNGRPDEAEMWLRRMCPVVTKAQCELVERVWVDMATRDAAMATVKWPRQ